MTTQDPNHSDGFLAHRIRLAPYVYGLIDAGMLLTCLPLSRLRSRVKKLFPEAETQSNINHRASFFALWGSIVALISLLPVWGMQMLGVPQPVPMVWAALVAVLITGALHEDGLADCVDGWFGSHLPQRRREIMKDSRIGNFGGLTLIFSLLLRLMPLMLLPLTSAIAAFVTAHILGRGLLPVAWALLATRSRKTQTGLAAMVPDVRHGACAALLAVLLTLPVLPSSAWVLVVTLTFLVVMAVLALSLRKIGTIAGDSLGAAEQCAEMTVMWTLLMMFYGST